MANEFHTHFNYRPMKDLAGFLGSYNMGSQTIAIDDVNAENIQSSGGGSAMLDGEFIPSLAADAELDVSADTVGDAAGEVVQDGYDVYVMVAAASDGTLALFMAGVEAPVGTAVLKIPDWDYETLIPVAIGLIVNDSGGDLTIGTTALTGDITFYDLTGPVFPHPDNIDLN